MLCYSFSCHFPIAGLTANYVLLAPIHDVVHRVGTIVLIIMSSAGSAEVTELAYFGR